MLLLSLDLKVDVHRKNSSESSEEVATLRPVVEKVSVHRAEQCTQADHEQYRTKLQGNPSFPILLYCKHEEWIIHKLLSRCLVWGCPTFFDRGPKLLLWVGYQVLSFIHSFIHSIGMCRMQRFLALLTNFFHSSLLRTFSCHPSPPTVLPSSLTSSCSLFLGMPLNLFVPRFIYSTLLGIQFSTILCTWLNQHNLFNLVSVIVGFLALAEE